MEFSSPITEIINRRFSCRTYLKSPIKEDKRKRLSEYARAAEEGPFGTRLRFMLAAASDQDSQALKGLGTYGFIQDPRGFLIGAMPDGDKNLEDYGYMMEYLILAATSLELGTCWLGGSFTKSRFAKKISTSSAERVPAVTSVGHMKALAGTVDSAIRRGANADKRLAWQEIFFVGEFGAPISLEEAGAYAVPLNMVQLGPSASNRQPWRIIKAGSDWHFYLQRSKGYRKGMIMRLMKIDDMQRLDLGIAMCHFELTAREAGLAGEWQVREPGIKVPDSLTEYTVTWTCLD